jgi:hypothetical protein
MKESALFLWKGGRSMMRNKIIAVFIILGLVVGGSLSVYAAERQPHMTAALESLQNAKAELEKGSADKGGHRAKAIDLVNQAIYEVKKGIEYDIKH